VNKKITIILAFLLLSSLYCLALNKTPIVHAQTVYFADDFENGVFVPPWNGTFQAGESATGWINTAESFSGSYSAFFSQTYGDINVCYYNTGANQSAISMREYFYWASGRPVSGDVEGIKFMSMGVKSNSYNYTVTALIYNNTFPSPDVWAVRYMTNDSVLHLAISSTPALQNQWYCVELDVTQNSGFNFYINGNSVVSVSSITLMNTLQYIESGNALCGNGSNSFYIDDVALANNGYIGIDANPLPTPAPNGSGGGPPTPTAVPTPTATPTPTNTGYPTPTPTSTHTPDSPLKSPLTFIQQNRLLLFFRDYSHPSNPIRGDHKEKSKYH
jgi:hypothetical protein